MTEAPFFLDPIHHIPGIRAAWIPRVPNLPISGDRDQAMRTLRPFHEQAITHFGGTPETWWRAEQIHSANVAIAPNTPTIIAPDGLPVVPGVDGLLTQTPGIILAIYVADCGAIWLADRKTHAVGLLHSGKKGTENNILKQALEIMVSNLDSNPSDIVAILGPCIRPPDYEVDFAAEIARQATSAGIGEFIDCGENTASDLNRHYSYRTEKGITGRMMALITCDPN